MSAAAVFRRHVFALGDFWLRRLRLADDLAVIHGWVSREYARYWGMVGYSLEQVHAGYVEICRHADVYLGFHHGAPAFLLECYDPANDPVGQHYDVQPGDRGMHILVAPAQRPIPGFTWHVFTVVMDFLFSDPTVRRVVVEPDVRNEKIHALNRRAGFAYQKIIELPKKTACLAFCTRAQYRAALRSDAMTLQTALRSAPEFAATHLRPEVWANVNRKFIRKALSELAHERLIEPQPRHRAAGWMHYLLATDVSTIEYRFRAQVLSLDHWRIDPDSIQKFEQGEPAPLDAMRFIIELRRTLALDGAVLPTYLEEIASTLYAAAYKHAAAGPSAAELARAEFQDIEAAMIEGHPAFLANSGRIGFDAVDYHGYAPEAGAPVALIWLAAHASRATFAAAEGLTYERLMAEELGAQTVETFNLRLRRLGLDPAEYYFLPAHPWQWFNKLASLFAPDIAARRLVCLGYGADAYRPQQSIRTFFNLTHPHKRYVKTALSVLNMGFMRGLSPYYMRTTPAINDWLHRLIAQDVYLAAAGFTLLREVASIGYRHEHYETAIETDSPYKKMLAALWRESPVPTLKPGERLMTMAALLHVDREGSALLPALIELSGVDIDTWLRAYLRCYLSPLLHCFYAHDLVFMPHGENVILVLADHVPVRVFMKDIAEEAAILDQTAQLPENVRRLSVVVPEELKVLSIFTDVFDGILRHLAALLLEHADYSPARFWQHVAECVHDYQAAHPRLAEKFRRHDLFAREFARSCLNRLQLSNNQQMIDLANPAKNLKFAGTLMNPIARFRPAVVQAAAEIV